MHVCINYMYVYMYACITASCEHRPRGLRLGQVVPQPPQLAHQLLQVLHGKRYLNMASTKTLTKPFLKQWLSLLTHILFQRGYAQH